MLLGFIKPMLDWLQQHQAVGWWMAGISALMFLGALVLLPIVVVRIPADYFSHNRPPEARWKQMHPVLRGIALVLKNLAGAVLLVAGIVMLIAPGQGILSVLLGLALLDIPGKRKLERWIVMRPAVFSAINKLRARYNHQPLEKPE